MMLNGARQQLLEAIGCCLACQLNEPVDASASASAATTAVAAIVAPVLDSTDLAQPKTNRPRVWCSRKRVQIVPSPDGNWFGLCEDNCSDGAVLSTDEWSGCSRLGCASTSAGIMLFWELHCWQSRGEMDDAL